MKDPGDSSGEATPVPIPNTEVKLSSAEDTQGVAPRENRSSPGSLPIKAHRSAPPRSSRAGSFDSRVILAPTRVMLSAVRALVQRWQPRHQLTTKPPADISLMRVPQRGHG